MILSQKNNLLYDSKNFDKYGNIYAVKINNDNIKFINELIENNDSKLHSKYNEYALELILYFLVENVNLNDIYKIIFGHYYNNQNLFLYKKLNNKKINSSNIYHCKKNELLHNNLNSLIFSNSYDNIKDQVDILIKIKKDRLKTLCPINVNYENNNENLNIETNGKLETSYFDECLNIKNI
jgi:hypothetical protein